MWCSTWCVCVCVCVCACMISTYRMQNTPISPPIVSTVLPWWCIPGQGLAVICTDPGGWPLTFRPWPGSKGQRWPEGNESTSMIGTLTCSLPPSSAALTSLPVCTSHLHLLQSEDHRLQEAHPAVLHCTLAGSLLCAHGNARLNILSFAFSAATRSRFLCFSFVQIVMIKCNL